MDELGNTKERMIIGNGYEGKVDDRGRFSHCINNGHGDIVQTLAFDGELENYYVYDIFGNTTLEGEQYPFQIRYAGEYYDKDAELYYLRARHYNPSTGRFVSEDSYQGNANQPLSLNLYTYCYNNPIRYVDPSGHVVTEWDRQNLTSGQVAMLEKLTDNYNEQESMGSVEGTYRAHLAAEAIRNTARVNDEIGTGDGFTVKSSAHKDQYEKGLNLAEAIVYSDNKAERDKLISEYSDITEELESLKQTEAGYDGDGIVYDGKHGVGVNYNLVHSFQSGYPIEQALLDMNANTQISLYGSLYQVGSGSLELLGGYGQVLLANGLISGEVACGILKGKVAVSSGVVIGVVGFSNSLGGAAEMLQAATILDLDSTKADFIESATSKNKTTKVAYNIVDIGSSAMSTVVGLKDIVNHVRNGGRIVEVSFKSLKEKKDAREMIAASKTLSKLGERGHRAFVALDKSIDAKTAINYISTITGVGQATKYINN